MACNLPYEVWMTRGQGGMCIAAFESREDAEEYFNKCLTRKDGSYAMIPVEDIRKWDGDCYGR